MLLLSIQKSYLYICARNFYYGCSTDIFSLSGGLLTVLSISNFSFKAIDDDDKT